MLLDWMGKDELPALRVVSKVHSPGDVLHDENDKAPWISLLKSGRLAGMTVTIQKLFPHPTHSPVPLKAA